MHIIIKNLKTNWPFLIIILVMLYAFWPFFFQGKIPVAGDILLGQYYPWLDSRWDNRITNYPVLNNTIADSIFSFYPWKLKAIEIIKQGSFPIYEPSTYMGSQLFATGTTGLFYPLNVIFFLMDFNYGWGIIVSSTIFLSASFFYIWLRSKGLEKLPTLICAISYGLSAFIGLQVTFINTSHSVLWLPIILFSIDKIFKDIKSGYFLLLVFSLFATLNAGFFQGSLYTFLTAVIYAIFYLLQNHQYKRFMLITSAFIFSILLSSIQILPFLEATRNSSRLANYGGSAVQSEIVEFFVRAKFFITTIIPDFFGNPGKGNYTAEPGYYEFNNYVGTITIIGFVFGLSIIKKHKEVILFLGLLIFSVIFASHNFISIIPYQYSIPVLSSLVPARLLAVTQFSLLVIAAFGLNTLYLRKVSMRKFMLITINTSLLYALILSLTYASSKGYISMFDYDIDKWSVAFRNTIIPSAVFVTGTALIALYLIFKKKALFFILIVLSSLELVRQTSYFRPFISPDLIYPKTPTITFLEQNLSGYRMMINKQDLIPTNSQLVYNLKIVDGEGPIYPKNHGDFIGAINSPDFSSDLPQFRRMIYFRNYNTPPLDLLNIKYVVSSDLIDNPNLKLVFEEGSTKIYENLNNLGRAWSSASTIYEANPLKAMKLLVASDFDPIKTTVTNTPSTKSFAKADIGNFTQENNKITFKTKSEGESLVVVSEQFYPDWRLFIDDKESKPFPADFNLIGLNIPEGEHQIKLVYEMPALKYGAIISISTLAVLAIFVTLLKYKRLKFN